MLNRYFCFFCIIFCFILLFASQAKGQRRELARLDEILVQAYNADQSYRYAESSKIAIQVIEQSLDLMGQVNAKQQPQFLAQLHDRMLQGVELVAQPMLLQGYGARVRFLANRYLDESIDRIGPRYHTLARMFKILGDEAALSGDTAKALDWYKKGGQLNYIPGGEAALIFADLNDALALLWAGRGDFRSAFQELERSDQLIKRNLKKDHPSYSDRWFNYAKVCSLQGDYRNAHEYFLKAMKHTQKNKGEGSLQTVPILLALGNLDFRQEQYIAAGQQYAAAQKLAATFPDGFAPIAYDLKMAQFTLARRLYEVNAALEQLAEAEKLTHARADSISRKLKIHRLRTDLLTENNRYAAALNSVIAWEAYRQKLKGEGPDIDLDLQLLKGRLLTEMSRFSAAEPFLRHVWAWRLDEPNSTPALRWNAAAARIHWALVQGRTDNAKQWLSESVDWAAASPCTRAAWAAQHAELSERTAKLSDWVESAKFGLGEIPETGCLEEKLRLYELLARAEVQKGELTSAAALIQHVIESRKNRNELYHPQTARMYFAWAELKLQNLKREDAQKDLNEARRIFSAVYGPKHISEADVLVLEAQILLASGKNEGFMEKAVDAWALYDRLPDRPSSYRTRLNLILTEWYARKGEIERADRYLSYALRTPVGREEYVRFMAQPERARLMAYVRLMHLAGRLNPVSDGKGRNSR